MQIVDAAARAAAAAAAGLVPRNAIVGLGAGSTVSAVVDALADLGTSLGGVVAGSPATAAVAEARGLPLVDLDDVTKIDLAIDGADQVDPRGWLIKGCGGAHTRERIVLSAARYVVIVVSERKLVARLQAPVPLEIVPFAARTTLAKLGHATLRDLPPSPDGGLLAAYLGPVGDPATLARRFDATAGLVSHGLFHPFFVDKVLVGMCDGSTRTLYPKGD